MYCYTISEPLRLSTHHPANRGWTSLIIVADDDSRFAPGGDDAYYRNDPVKYDLNSKLKFAHSYSKNYYYKSSVGH
ncbi:Uncharacterized protein FWK35_00007680 [Aphis craccivora]|uniref:Uncharacterized protein n=1 Tax=Aphis craccivora TaxID=307492 RepID=A0A6G0Z1N5_APHCR|nr:Uncharacterized protein FWK35_00007680 [Aphis craccivora]